MKRKSKKKETNRNRESKTLEVSPKEEKEGEDEDENIVVNKIHIYNNNRHLQKSNSAMEIRPFFEPYYSEIKNNINNNLFNSKPVKKSVFQIEYVNFPKIDRKFLDIKLPIKTIEKKIPFPDNDLRRYNNYNINYYNNNSYGMNNYNYYNNNSNYYKYKNNLPNINNNYNNYGYNNRNNQGYDYNNYSDYGYRRKGLGELYSQMFLSRDNNNDMNSKIRKYYLRSIEQPDVNKGLYNNFRIREYPRKYTFKNLKKDDIIINDLKASRKFREFVFFQNLKKYIEPKQSIIDKDNIDDKSDEKSELSSLSKNSDIIKKSIKDKKSEVSSLHNSKEIMKEIEKEEKSKKKIDKEDKNIDKIIKKNKKERKEEIEDKKE